jgi:murein DD-endopeptidase MepM/ murein hydrolase activator NlpD
VAGRSTRNALLALLAVIAVGTGAGLAALTGNPSAPGASPSLRLAAASPNRSQGPSGTSGPTISPLIGPTVGPSSSPGSAASPSASPSSSPAVPGAAPTSAATFVAGKTVVPMGWPFAPSVKVRYGPGFGVFRVGVVEPFNMISGISKSGVLLRGHDGLDLQVPIGTPVLAPFSGLVIDPRVRWIPWDPALYGNVVAIQSDEPMSQGYSVILVHLSSIGVPIGAHVTRGQVVGLTGISGDAAGTIPHLHLELRAPFLIRYRIHGVIRQVDAFDPRPSLLAADPSHH